MVERRALRHPRPHLVAAGNRGGRAAFAERARQDWHDFLAARAVELRPGGRLVILGGGGDPDGLGGGEGLMDLANEVLEAIVADGSLRSGEKARMTIPTYYRTMAEYGAPFTPAGTAPDTAPLALVEARSVVFPDPYWEEYRRDGDKDAFAEAYAGFLRAFTETSLFGDLDRGAEAKQRLADMYYDCVQSCIAAAPERAVCAWRVALLTTAKRDAGETGAGVTG